MTDADDYCQEKAVKSGSSFYYSFLFLNTTQRQAITAVYAFCREVDDIVDDCSDMQVASTKLKWWQTELDRVFKGEASHPVGRALQVALKTYGLPKILFEEIVNGMGMDLQFQGYRTFADLEVYCHCVASAVGLLIIEIFGYTNEKTRVFASQLGIAFQLVNIIRDVGEDALRGRVYLPEEDLERFGLKAEAILNRQPSEEFERCMRFQAQRAREFYDKALEHLSPQDRGPQLPALIMARIYFTLLDEIEKANFQVLKQSIKLTPLRKLWLAFKCYWQEKRLRKRVKSL